MLLYSFCITLTENPKFWTNFISSHKGNFLLIGNFSLIEEQNKEHKKKLVHGKFLLSNQEYSVNVIAEHCKCNYQSIKCMIYKKWILNQIQSSSLGMKSLTVYDFWYDPKSKWQYFFQIID